MSDLTSKLMKLLKKDVLLQWTDSHEKDFQELKNNISSDACLQYFNHCELVILQVDTSKRRLGTVFIQKDSSGKDGPVAYASKRLIPS